MPEGSRFGDSGACAVPGCRAGARSRRNYARDFGRPVQQAEATQSPVRPLIGRIRPFIQVPLQSVCLLPDSPCVGTRPLRGGARIAYSGRREWSKEARPWRRNSSTNGFQQEHPFEQENAHDRVAMDENPFHRHSGPCDRCRDWCLVSATQQGYEARIQRSARRQNWGWSPDRGGVFQQYVTVVPCGQTHRGWDRKGSAGSS